MKNIGIYGLGLIGGSMGAALRATGRYRIYGADQRPEHIETAKKRGLIDDVLTEDFIPQLQGVILAVPVDALPDLALIILNTLAPDAWMFDTGSVKRQVVEKLKNHPRRGQFVAAHPIAGTEYSGPGAAFPELFRGKINIICDPEDTSEDILASVTKLFEEDLEMEVHIMPARQHDKHIAYVSHLSHVSAFTLGKTVLDVEDDERNIFLMAGSGFASTVRLAKSSPGTWTPILLQNRDALLPVLETYEQNLKLFIDLLQKGRSDALYDLLSDINRIGFIIDRIAKKHEKR